MVRTKTPGLSTQILVNDQADSTLQKSAARDIIADGHWHLYTWQINSSRGWKDFVKGHGDNFVGGAFTLNSILVNGKSNASLALNDVVYEEYPNTSGPVEHLSYNGGGSGSGGAIINSGGYAQFSAAH